MIFFEKNNFTDYWIIDGTLIGFIREQGPIPYDYDIDLAMGRKDFERLTKLLDENPQLQNEDELEWYNHYDEL